MDFPAHLKYTKDHEWLFVEGEVAAIGITEYALEQLGDLVHIELPEVGQEFEAGDTFGTVESTKTVSDLYMPIAGKVVEVNETVGGELESLGEDPYDGGWLVRIEPAGQEGRSSLMTAKQYQEFIAEQHD